jgi:hypothetical protein
MTLLADPTTQSAKSSQTVLTGLGATAAATLLI